MRLEAQSSAVPCMRTVPQKVWDLDADDFAGCITAHPLPAFADAQRRSVGPAGGERIVFAALPGVHHKGPKGQQRVACRKCMLRNTCRAQSQRSSDTATVDLNCSLQARWLMAGVRSMPA